MPSTMLDAEEALFAPWAARHPGFVRDGVVDENVYAAQVRKVLFLLKEVNCTKGGGWDLREFLGKNNGRGATWNNITRWARVIQAYPNVPAWKAVNHITPEFRAETLKTIAAMNLKKVPGGGSCDGDALWRVAQEDAVDLRAQLALYRPDVVVCCGTWPLAAKVLEVPGKPVATRYKRFRYVLHDGTYFIDCTRSA